jgi:diguanylate cyclase (GGDEF)-like protein
MGRPDSASQKLMGDELLNLVRRTALLKPLPEEELRGLLTGCRQLVLQPGEALCREGEEGHAMFVVLSGHLVISRSGKQVAVGSPGDVFGEMALIESRERAATLKALDETVVLEIPETAFWKHIAPNPESLMALLRTFSDRSRHDLEALASDNLKLQAYAEQVETANRELVQIRRQLEDKNRLLERLSALDTLTGIANRRRFDDVLRQEWKRAARDGRSLALLFCDIDHFKLFNDTYGHQAGDDCLVRVAQAMEDTLNRPADLAARYGGEEFVGLLADTDEEGAHLLAERVRARVAELEIEHVESEASGVLTVSLGAASRVPGAAMRPEDLVNEADRALYAAKQRGRNRVVLASTLPEATETPE